jgi:cellulose biosynthesis protein BcsQ
LLRAIAYSAVPTSSKYWDGRQIAPKYARSTLKNLADQYDICVIDIPPTMSNLLVAGIICADLAADAV